jgi:hypothetical protein
VRVNSAVAMIPCTCGLFAFTLCRPGNPDWAAFRILPLQLKVPSLSTTAVQIVYFGAVTTPVLNRILTVCPGVNPCPSTTICVFTAPDDGVRVIAGPVTSRAAMPSIAEDGSRWQDPVSQRCSRLQLRSCRTRTR